MSSPSQPGFNPFAPGFDFLQSLMKTGAASGPGGTPMANWVAPTLDPAELDKRISELKTVHYWLDQNTRALAATIQALEVQKMTLATLQTMNLNMADFTKPFQAPGSSQSAQVNPPEATPGSGQAQTPKPGETAANRSKPQSAKPQASQATASDQKNSQAQQQGIDPLQMWSALTQQFQQIAAHAMADLGKNAAADSASAPQASANKGSASPKAAKPTRPKRPAAKNEANKT